MAGVVYDAAQTKQPQIETKVSTNNTVQPTLNTLDNATIFYRDFAHDGLHEIFKGKKCDFFNNLGNVFKEYYFEKDRYDCSSGDKFEHSCFVSETR